MEPHDPEGLRAKLQARHIAVVQTEIDLVRALIKSGKVRLELGFPDAAAFSFARAQRTIDLTRQGLPRIDIGERCTLLENILDELQADLSNFLLFD